MSLTETEQQRHAEERGAILRTLKEDFAREMTTARVLGGALDAQGISLSPAGLNFHLVYLEGQGYVTLTRARDLPGFRTDRWKKDFVKPETIVGAKLAAKGLQLLDGAIEEDPLVKF